jgi:hypothetical protein
MRPCSLVVSNASEVPTTSSSEYGNVLSDYTALHSSCFQREPHIWLSHRMGWGERILQATSADSAVLRIKNAKLLFCPLFYHEDVHSRYQRYIGNVLPCTRRNLPADNNLHMYDKKKVKLFLCLIKYYDMKVYGGINM